MRSEDSRMKRGRENEVEAEKKERKYRRVETEMRAVHLPFAVETMGGLSKSALQLVREIHHSASTHCTWRNADTIGSHLLDCVAIAVQRCTGMALRASVERETARALGLSGSESGVSGNVRQRFQSCCAWFA